MTADPTPTPGRTHEQWLAAVVAIVGVAQAMLREPLSGDPHTLRDQATQTEDYAVQLAEALSQAEAWLDFQEAAEMGKIDSDLTVARQAVELKRRTIPHRLLRDKLAALTVSMKSRMRRAQWHS